MTANQWLLLVLIVAVVAGIYFYVRHQAGENPWDDMESGDDEAARGDSYIVGVKTVSGGPQTAEPDLEAEQPPAPEGEAPVGRAVETPAGLADRQKPATPAPREKPKPKGTSPRPPAEDGKLVVLHVACRGDDYFDGPDIHDALRAQGLEFGARDIYHRIDIEAGESVYAVANMIKPGLLDPVDQDHLSTPGLTMFLTLPGPWDGGRALRDMLETAGALAQQLGGEVLDDGRALLKPQTAQFMLDEVAEMDRKRRVQQGR